MRNSSIDTHSIHSFATATDAAATSFVNQWLQQPLRGAYCELHELTSARFAAANWLLRQRKHATNPQFGSIRSAIRGRGLEFEEVRAYQAGDDVRNIDWRVTARSGRPFTKLFREERERPVLLVVDQSQPMFFGSRSCFKSKLAAWLGAVLAWAAIENGDRIGGLIIGNNERREIRPRRARKTTMSWLNLLLDFNRQLKRDTQLPDAAQSLLTALTDLRRIARPGSTIYLISDFHGSEHPQVREQLYALARHCEVRALFIFDPLEQELPPPALYTVTDSAQRFVLDSGERLLREQHRNKFSAQRDGLQQLLNSLGIPLTTISTNEPPLQAFTARTKS
ncbi:MAG: hypothetical protein JWM78_528 [Verrucomicrobiaceae bacterium]|nr:hypothetical protein [Verrucomicrobiaceae bacterium]